MVRASTKKKIYTHKVKNWLLKTGQCCYGKQAGFGAGGWNLDFQLHSDTLAIAFLEGWKQG